MFPVAAAAANSASGSAPSTPPPIILTSGGMDKPKMDNGARIYYDAKSGDNIYENRYKDTSKRFRGFWHLILMWKCSVLKLVWHDLIVFVGLYVILSVIYRCVIFDNERQREVFELICVYCAR